MPGRAGVPYPTRRAGLHLPFLFTGLQPQQPNPLIRYETVIFDCDSTLSDIEGIEELAAAHRDEVARLTDAAMRGEISLERVYGHRLELVRPTRDRMEVLGRQYVERLVPDAREVVAALQGEGIDVRIVSGGLLPAVLAVARELGLGESAVAAVDLYFDQAGEYTGFDTESPLAYSGGKRDQLLRWWSGMPGPVMLVGDGITDLEARPPANLFVAYAGVVARPAVVAAADVVVHARSLATVLPLALGGVAPTRPESRALFDLGLALMHQGPADSGA